MHNTGRDTMSRSRSVWTLDAVTHTKQCPGVRRLASQPQTNKAYLAEVPCRRVAVQVTIKVVLRGASQCNLALCLQARLYCFETALCSTRDSAGHNQAYDSGKQHFCSPKPQTEVTLRIRMADCFASSITSRGSTYMLQPKGSRPNRLSGFHIHCCDPRILARPSQRVYSTRHEVAWVLTSGSITRESLRPIMPTALSPDISWPIQARKQLHWPG